MSVIPAFSVQGKGPVFSRLIGEGEIMPHVNVKMYPGRTKEQKRALTQKILDAFAETLNVSPKHLTVVIEEVAPEDWNRIVVEPEIKGKKDLLYKEVEYL